MQIKYAHDKYIFSNIAHKILRQVAPEPRVYLFAWKLATDVTEIKFYKITLGIQILYLYVVISYNFLIL